MSQLACCIVGPSIGIITECGLQINLPVLDHSFLEFVFCSGVCHDLPLVGSLSESSWAYCRSEQISVLWKENVTVLGRELNGFRGVVRIPAKVCFWGLLNTLNIVDWKALSSFSIIELCWIYSITWGDNLTSRSCEICICHCSLESEALSTRKRTLEEFQTIQITFVFLDLVKFR